VTADGRKMDPYKVWHPRGRAAACVPSLQSTAVVFRARCSSARLCRAGLPHVN
jgi:hypothetical protein